MFVKEKKVIVVKKKKKKERKFLIIWAVLLQNLFFNTNIVHTHQQTGLSHAVVNEPFSDNSGG